MRQMSNGERWQAVGMLRAGSSYRVVAQHFGRCHETIRKLWVKFGATGNVQHAGKGRIRRHTTTRADRRLVRMTRANPTLPSTLLRLMWGERNKWGHTLSSQTVRKRLWEYNLRCRRMVRRPRLTPAHVSHRERWGMQRVHWRLRQWRRVLFTDESRFRLFRADGRIRVWRGPRQEFLSQHVQTSEGQAPSLHVWAGIALSGKTELVFLRNSVTASTYKDILEEHVHPFMVAKFGGTNNCILQDDNATPHRAACVRLFKEELGIRTLKWPSRSPDMNPIEHVWSYMKRIIQNHGNPPQTLQQLQNAMVECWDQTPQPFIRRLICGMPRRISSLLNARGGHTRY